MRVDIFIRYKKPDTQWHCYCQSVTKTNAMRIAKTLEQQGEHVALFKCTKTLGKQVYETGEQS